MKQQPRVAIITPGTYPIPDPESTAVETVVHKLTTQLQNHIECFVFGSKTKEHPENETVDEITYCRFPFRNGDNYIRNCLPKLEKINPDIIQVENRPKYIKILREAFPSKEIWLFVHSTVFLNRGRISKKELLECINCTDRIIVNSHYIKDYVVRNTNFTEEKVYVNHLGIDTNQFQSRYAKGKCEEIKQFKRDLKIENKKIVLYVGRLTPSKGVDHLLRVFPDVLRAEPNTVLFIVGSAFYGINKETEYVKKLHSLSESAADAIQYIPYIPHDKIHQWFQIADIIVVPSVAEPFGLVNIEAMATGATVIGTNAGGIPEIIDHEKTGILINPNQLEKDLCTALINLLKDLSYTRSLGKNAISKVHDVFTWEHSAKRMLQLYRNYSR